MKKANWQWADFFFLIFDILLIFGFEERNH